MNCNTLVTISLQLVIYFTYQKKAGFFALQYHY